MAQRRLTDRSVVGVQVLGSHKLRHQGALADGRGAQHEDAVRRRALGRAALPRARQRARRRVPRRSWVRSGQMLRAASNRRKARRVSRLGMQLDHRSVVCLGAGTRVVFRYREIRSRSPPSEDFGGELTRARFGCSVGKSRAFEAKAIILFEMGGCYV